MQKNIGRTVLFLMAVFALGSLAGCGQKGDLYLPDDRQSATDTTIPHYV